VKFSSRKQSTVVGLDVEAGSVAATEIHVNGGPRLGRTGIAPLDAGITREGEITDPEALGAALKDLFAAQKLARNVRVGVANQRVVVRTLRMPLIEDPDELETAVRFQAPDHVPMPIEQAVLDWQVIAQGVGESGRQMDVVVVAARRDMVGALAEALRVGGLRPVGIDVSAFGMLRALTRDEPPSPGVPYEERIETTPDEGIAQPQEAGAATPAKLYCNLGDVTNLAVARGRSCLFTRVSPFGVEGIAQKLAERRELTLEHARQWLVHVGLEKPIEAIEGDSETVAATREALSEGASKLADELRLSLDFYGAQEDALAVEEIVACGPGTTIEGLGERLQLADAAAARLTLSYGLALEE
jgi:type IV pilus assembly protein PilM